MLTVLRELRFGHTTSTLLGMNGLAWVILEKCPTVMLCATADEEFGRNLKLGSCVDQPHSVTKKLL